jgi:hypothetical protein
LPFARLSKCAIKVSTFYLIANKLISNDKKCDLPL